jgi:hypothetical protein
MVFPRLSAQASLETNKKAAGLPAAARKRHPALTIDV